MRRMYHVNNTGDLKRCTATAGRCPYGAHGETREALEAFLAENYGGVLPSAVSKPSPLSKGFQADSYFGDLAPRAIQVQPMNDVVTALENEDATQLVAACGTGKTYMHRQLLAHALGQEDANGIGVVLTSSIRLAQDTANDLRPVGGYDRSLGEFGVDYEVIEVHSDARPAEGRPSVRENGVISVERIQRQLEEALAAGKKAVIVSTYDSVAKVQEAQARMADQDAARVDLLIHDEAHNILGQQRPTAVASDENELTAYVGFHDSIPGALQAAKRLYSTATPVVRETESEKPGAESLEEAIGAAERMRAGDQRERVTLYSDHPLVGRVSGFISQEEAIENACLATPTYELRSAKLRSSLRGFTDPVVEADGTVVERSAATAERPLSVATYGALNATLDALVADPAGPGDNPAHNALAYVGSIHQAEGFKEAYRAVALARAEGMSLEDARRLSESEDVTLRLRARMRLLAEHTEVKAAHSNTDSESVRERREAFAMFHGHAVEAGAWSPHKRVLANVDIFSEGVSIPEIDAVVISDDNKLNEKSMTQAIGRAIRVIPDNDYKRHGRVIIPSVQDADGQELTSSSVTMAAYTATRVERGSTVARLQGRPVRPDEETAFTAYAVDGSSSTVLARDLARAAVTDLRDLAVAYDMRNSHLQLMEKDPAYKTLSSEERFQARKSSISERLERLKKDSPQRRYLLEVQAHMQGKSRREVERMDRSGRVLSAALAAGDVSSIHPAVASEMIKKGVLKTASASELSLEEKRSFLSENPDEFAYSLMTRPPTMSEPHEAARTHLTSGMAPDKSLMKDSFSLVVKGGGDTPSTLALRERYSEMLSDPAFVESAFKAFNGKDSTPPPALSNVKAKEAIVGRRATLWSALLERQHGEAERGDQAYSVDSEAVKKTGELTVAALRNLLVGDEA